MSRKRFYEIGQGEVETALDETISFSSSKGWEKPNYKLFSNNMFLDGREDWKGFSTDNCWNLIDGHTKTKKSTFCTMIAAAHLSVSGIYENIKSTYDINQHIVWFDTEQNKGEFQNMMSNILRMSGNEKKPDNFHAYNIKYLTPEERVNAIINKIKTLLNKYSRNGKIKEEDRIAMIFIDHIGDLVNSPNNKEEINDIFELLNHLVKITGATIFIVIHKNKNDQSPMGMLGGDLKKKATVYFSAVKDKNSGPMDPSKIILNEARIPVYFKPFYFNYRNNLPIVLE
jgi:hypothetical protein